VRAQQPCEHRRGPVYSFHAKHALNKTTTPLRFGE
jgi:hypothetical protein